VPNATLRLLLVLFAWACTPCLHAQEPEEPPAATAADESPRAIQKQIDAVKADTTLAEEPRTALLDALEKALAAAQSVESFTNKAAAFVLERDEAPARLRAARDELSALGAVPEPTVPAGTALRELENLLGEAQAEHRVAADTMSGLEREATRRGERRATIPTRLGEARSQLDALPVEPPVDAALDPRLVGARQLRHRLERRALQTEIQALEAELSSYDGRSELLTARRDLASRRQQVARARAESFGQQVSELRAAEAARSEAEARRAAEAASNQHPMLASLAAENAEIAAKLPSLAEAQTQAQGQLERIKALRQDLSSQFEDIKARALRAGSSAAIGSLLRERRAQLTDVDRRAQRAAGRSGEAAEAYLAALDWEQRRRVLVDDAGQLERLLATAEPPLVDPVVTARVRADARTLLDDRLRMLETLANGWSQQLANLEERATARTLLLDLVEQYRTFINERVLWIRSSQPVWQLNLAELGNAISWLGSPTRWIDALSTLSTAISLENPFTALGMLLLLALLGLRPLLLRRLHRIGDVASRGSNTRYTPTAIALVYTALLALPLPGLLFLLGRHLLTHPDCTDFARSIGTGALASAGLLAVVRALLATARPGGLAERHFQWSASTLSLVRGNLPWLLPAAFPLTLLLGALAHHANDAWIGSLGRLLLVLYLLFYVVFAWRTLHPTTGVLGSSLQDDLLRRGRRAWFLLAVGTPLALLVMALLGYDYTSLQLSQRLTSTMILVLGCALGHSLVLRGLLLARRRLSLAQMRERMRLAQAAREGDDSEAEPEPEVALDAGSIALQTQALLRAAVVIVAITLGYQIWIDVLPALGVFRDVTLWTEANSDPTQPGIPITLADLLLGLVAALLTVLAARNLPGLLELLVLQRLALPAGERHAITTLARYVLVAVGVGLAFNAVGLGWAKMQWLLAGLSLGLGFGLQEIFANFISGIILLLERPVRVGDIVVLGDLLGKVTRIQIRATTIRDLDNKEMVVPNKEFVTGRFINWTLTESTVRMRLRVGVAYGSDTRKARELLVRAAVESPLAARSPRPKALFLGFGDSTLDLELRVYVEDYDTHADMLDDLHTRIDDLFRQNGIEIAFPQRDLHLRTARPLVEFLEKKSLPPEDRD